MQDDNQPLAGKVALVSGGSGWIGSGIARHLAAAPNGDVYVALQGTGEKGGVTALRDTNGDGTAVLSSGGEGPQQQKRFQQGQCDQEGESR